MTHVQFSQHEQECFWEVLGLAQGGQLRIAKFRHAETGEEKVIIVAARPNPGRSNEVIAVPCAFLITRAEIDAGFLKKWQPVQPPPPKRQLRVAPKPLRRKA